MDVSDELTGGVSLAPVRTLGMPRKLSSEEDVEDFEQELVDQYALAQVGSGLTDSYVADERSAVFEFRRFLDRPVWTATPEDADRFLISVRKKGRSPATPRTAARLRPRSAAPGCPTSAPWPAG